MGAGDPALRRAMQKQPETEVNQTVVGYPRYLFSIPILASSAFQNVPYSYFIIFMHLKIQAFAVGGSLLGDTDGMVHDDYFISVQDT